MPVPLAEGCGRVDSRMKSRLVEMLEPLLLLHRGLKRAYVDARDRDVRRALAN